MEIIVHKVNEVQNLPWDKLDPDKCSRDWSFGRGGYGLDNKVYTISLLRDKKGNICDVWELPAAIGAMLDMVRCCSADEARQKIKTSMGI